MPFGLGIWEVVILLGILLLLFGAKGVPQMARRLGTGVREVKDAVAEVDPRKMLDAPEEPEKPARSRQQARQPQQPAPPQQGPPAEPPAAS
ncbi:MAG: Sec-independent protein translocase subunit TatA/TatB [Gaiellaceae bacterium]